jgi:hypothetical protein
MPRKQKSIKAGKAATGKPIPVPVQSIIPAVKKFASPFQEDLMAIKESVFKRSLT